MNRHNTEHQTTPQFRQYLLNNTQQPRPRLQPLGSQLVNEQVANEVVTNVTATSAVSSLYLCTAALTSFIGITYALVS